MVKVYVKKKDGDIVELPPRPVDYLDSFQSAPSSIPPASLVWIPDLRDEFTSSKMTYILFGKTLLKTFSHNAVSSDDETRAFLEQVKDRCIQDKELMSDITAVLLNNTNLYFPEFLSFDQRMDFMCEEALNRVNRHIQWRCSSAINLWVNPRASQALTLRESSSNLQGSLTLPSLQQVLGREGVYDFHLKGALRIFAEKGITLDVPDGQRIDLAPRPITIAKTTFLQRLYRLTVLGPYRTLRWLVTGDIK